MDAKTLLIRFASRMSRWLRQYKTSILVAGIIFFILMYMNIPGFQASDMDKVFGSIVLALGLLNFTYWTLINKQVAQAQDKRKIKGRRKS